MLEFSGGSSAGPMELSLSPFRSIGYAATSRPIQTSVIYREQIIRMTEETPLAQARALKDATTLGGDLAKALLGQHVLPEQDGVLIQCGHFSLIQNRPCSKFVPAVPGETLEP